MKLDLFLFICLLTLNDNNNNNDLVELLKVIHLLLLSLLLTVHTEIDVCG